MTVPARLLWLCGCFWASFVFADKSPTVLDYSFDVWQTENGLPYNSVTAIVQTRDGFIWLGTYNGLVRFDGVQFTVFDTSNTPQLRSSRVTSLFEDAQGVLWIGHETGGLTKYANGQFTHVVLGGDWPGGEVSAINTDDAGDLWLLNNSGWLFRPRDEFSIPGGKGGDTTDKVSSLVKEKNGKLWCLRDTMLESFRTRPPRSVAAQKRPDSQYLRQGLRQPRRRLVDRGGRSRAKMVHARLVEGFMPGAVGNGNRHLPA